MIGASDDPSHKDRRSSWHRSSQLQPNDPQYLQPAFGAKDLMMSRISDFNETSSTSETLGCSFLVRSSYSSSSCCSAIDGDKRRSDNFQKTTTPRQIRKRPRISNFHHTYSMSKARNNEELSNKYWKLSPISIKRRCVSADACYPHGGCFASPNRYTGVRSQLEHNSSPLRTNCSPDLLWGREKRYRARDVTLDPFRLRGSPRLRYTVKIPQNEIGRRPRVPYHVPSFASNLDTSVQHSHGRSEQANMREVSTGGVWVVGGRAAAVPNLVQGIDNGRGATLASGTNAPLWTTQFHETTTENDKLRSHEARIALALNIDTAQRVLPVDRDHEFPNKDGLGGLGRFSWRDNMWTRRNCLTAQPKCATQSELKAEKVVPTIPFRVLDAPRLKDDYYCSVLAYSHNCRTLAVALTHRVYLWTEQQGVRYPPFPPGRLTNYVSALAFSSELGAKAILAVARNSGHVTLWSLSEQRPRFEIPHPWATCCAAFKPIQSTRQSPISCKLVTCEDLLIGDDAGCLYYYAVEWPQFEPGSIVLLTKLHVHSQNLCGLAWSPDGRTFVTGGNDNTALLFEAEEMLQTAKFLQERSDEAGSAGDVLEENFASSSSSSRPRLEPVLRSSGQHDLLGSWTNQGYPNAEHLNLSRTSSTEPNSRGRNPTRIYLSMNRSDKSSSQSSPRQTSTLHNKLADPRIPGLQYLHKYTFNHSAAVKAIAYAPWQPTLLATSGGSNDRQIHFHHSGSGSTLAVINVFAQVTSLIWSSTRREIAATFGYAQPEHDVRIAVFVWPSCDCIVSIPWERKADGEIGRALWAIPYPGGPNDTIVDKPTENDEGHQTLESDEMQDFFDAPGLEESENHQRGLSFDQRATRWMFRRPQRGQHSLGRSRSPVRGEGEPWASRTEEEGSLIIACCDQTIKFFEVWAGKSKGSGQGLGSKAGVLGGSKILEGWCEGMNIQETETEEIIR